MAVRVYLNKKDLITVIKSYNKPYTMKDAHPDAFKTMKDFEALGYGTWYGIINRWIWNSKKLNNTSEDLLYDVYKTLKHVQNDKT